MLLFLGLLVQKNALQSCYGFSPNQPVFGKSANLPSNLANLPPAMENVSHRHITKTPKCTP